jgi:hypothetical protein
MPLKNRKLKNQVRKVKRVAKKIFNDVAYLKRENEQLKLELGCVLHRLRSCEADNDQHSWRIDMLTHRTSR